MTTTLLNTLQSIPGAITPIAKIIVEAPWFQRLVIAAILLAGLLAGLETDAGMLSVYGPLLHRLDAVVLGIFILEVALKIAAHGSHPLRYFRDGWNAFDFIVVALCCLPINSQFIAVMRLVRTLRLLRLISALPKLQMLVGALLKSLGSMGYVSMLLGIMFYIYAIMGVHLFQAVDPKHFGNLAVALLTLFQLITLDNWSDVFASASGSSPGITAAYFVSFIMLGTMIMLNLFIGVIMNSMTEMHAELETQQASDRPNLQTELRAIEQRIAALRTSLGELNTPPADAGR